MDALDLFFKKFSYKFDKGYPDMGNPKDVILLESILKELDINLKESLLLEITDREINTNTKKAVEYILSNANSELGFKPQSDKNRLGNPNKIDSEKIIQLFKDLLGAENITTYSPKQGPNPSGKFSMYEMDTDKFGMIRIIVSGGGNEGEKYEQNFVAKAKENVGKPNNELPNDLKTLYDKLGIDNTKLIANNIKFAGATDTKRSLSLDGPQDIGKTISDLTITYDNKEYFISLKNVAGSGVYSGPNVPFIYEKDGKVVYDESKKNTTPSIALLFDIFNIDSQKLADGLNQYVTKEGTEGSWSKAEIDTEKFKKLLASSLGYGYYYVRETKPGEVKVISLLSPEDAQNAIGNITNTEIKYPGPNTKQLTMKIDTNSPIFGISQYQVSIRNTSGKLLPLSLRISKTK
jgi:hypothetical protein